MSALMRQINLICRCGGAYRSDRLADTELLSFHQSFVFAVCNHPGMSQDALARHLCMNKSTVTRRLAFLEEHGYVSRVPSEVDRRVMLVYPTERMQAVLPRVREVTGEWNNAVTENISEEELSVFYAVLGRIADNARSLVGLAETNETGANE